MNTLPTTRCSYFGAVAKTSTGVETFITSGVHI